MKYRPRYLRSKIHLILVTVRIDLFIFSIIIAENIKLTMMLWVEIYLLNDEYILLKMPDSQERQIPI